MACGVLATTPCRFFFVACSTKQTISRRPFHDLIIVNPMPYAIGAHASMRNERFEGAGPKRLLRCGHGCAPGTRPGRAPATARARPWQAGWDGRLSPGAGDRAGCRASAAPRRDRSKRPAPAPLPDPASGCLCAAAGSAAAAAAGACDDGAAGEPGGAVQRGLDTQWVQRAASGLQLAPVGSQARSRERVVRAATCQGPGPRRYVIQALQAGPQPV